MNDVIKSTVILFWALIFFGCIESHPKTKVETTQESTELNNSETVTPDSIEIVPIRKPQREQYYYVNAKSGLNFRNSPKGSVVGKFRLNEQLIVIDHTTIMDTIFDSGKKIIGEWLGVKKQHDTVYVFDGFLSKNILVSDVKIYHVNPFIKKQDGPRSNAFLNLSNNYFSNKEPDTPILNKGYLPDTIILNKNQRRQFLNASRISEHDSVFIYEIKADSIHTFLVQDLPVIAQLNFYFEQSNREREEYDYEFGFNLGNRFTGGNDNFAFVGRENPFVTGGLKPMVWSEIQSEEFPLKFDPQIVPVRSRRWFKDYIPNKSFKFLDKNYAYYIQSLAKDGKVKHKYLVVIETLTDEIVFNNVLIDMEGTYLKPLMIENSGSMNEIFQWTGKLFKNKPPIIYGLIGHSFGCPTIDFLSIEEPPIIILCDNRH